MNLADADTPIRDILLPRTDQAVVIQFVVVAVLLVVAVVAVRRERALVLLVLGIGSVVLSIMGLRTVH